LGKNLFDFVSIYVLDHKSELDDRFQPELWQEESGFAQRDSEFNPGRFQGIRSLRNEN